MGFEMKISKEEFLPYAESTGDDDPLHFDEALAKKLGWGDVTVPAGLIVLRAIRIVRVPMQEHFLEKHNAYIVRRKVDIDLLAGVLPGVEFKGVATVRIKRDNLVKIDFYFSQKGNICIHAEVIAFITPLPL